MFGKRFLALVLSVLLMTSVVASVDVRAGEISESEHYCEYYWLEYADINPDYILQENAYPDEATCDSINVYTQEWHQVTFNINIPELLPEQQILEPVAVLHGFSVENMPATPDIPAAIWPTPPERLGYTFMGWYTDLVLEDGMKYTESSIIYGLRSLYARWEAIPLCTEYLLEEIVGLNGASNVTVTFVGNGAVIPSDPSHTIASGTALGGQFPTMIPVLDGFAFRHWNTVQVLTVVNPGTNFTSTTVVNADMNVYAQWGRQVSFNVNAPELPAAQQTLTPIVVPNGFSTDNMPVTLGVPVVIWPTPQRPGFNFVGWYTDPAPGLGVEYTAASIINGAVSLYARWEITPPYTVIFNLEGGTLVTGHTDTRLTRPGMSIGDSWLEPHSLNQDVLWPRSAPDAIRNNSNTPNGNLLIPSGSFRLMTLSGWYFEPFANTGQNFAPAGSSASSLRRANRVVTSEMVDNDGNFDVYARWVYEVEFRSRTLGTFSIVGTREILVTPETLSGGTIAEHGTLTSGISAGTIIESREFPIATRIGFTFVGWYNMHIPDNTDDANLPADARRLTVNCIVNTSGRVYARWISDGEAIIVFDLDGGDWTVQTDEIGERAVPAESTIFAHWGARSIRVLENNNLPPMPRYPTKPGHIFTGWFVGPQPLPDAISTGEAALRNNTGGGGRRFDGRSLVSAGGLTVYARWLPYNTVTFNPNGGEKRSLFLTYGNTRDIAQGWTLAQMNTVWGSTTDGQPLHGNFYSLGSIPNPVTSTISGNVARPNHIFQGWNTDSRGHGTILLNSTPITQSKSFYALWAPEITFNSNHSSFGGTDSTVIRNILYGRSIANHHLHQNTSNVALTMPAVSNWTGLHVPNRAFVGWNMNPDGSGDWFDSNTVIPYDAATGAGTGAPFTVYAIWVEGVAFNSGAAPMDSILEENRTREFDFPGTIGNSLGGMPPDPIWPSHTFRGWNTSPAGDLTWVGPDAVIPAPWTLYAMWEAHVTFDADGGTLVGQPVHTRNIGETIGTAVFPSATQQGRVFLGWRCPYGQPFTANTPILRSITVTALWGDEFTNVEVTFNANHGEIPEEALQLVTIGGTYATAMEHDDIAALTNREGYTFVGWFTAAEGGEHVAVNTIVTNTENHTLYARWSASGTPPQLPPQLPPQFPPQLPELQQEPVIEHPSLPATYIPWRPRPRVIQQDTVLYVEYDEPTLVPVDPIPTTSIHHAFMIGFAEDGTIRPHANITRAEAAAIFFRLTSDEHRANIWSQTNTFADVSINRWFNNPISTMENGGLFVGIPLGENFNPNQAATRAEFAAMVVSYLGLGNYNAIGSDAFTDIEGHWASDAINAAYSQGWVRGFGDGTFRPDQPITRAEVAALVNRALGRLPEFHSDLLDGMLTWPDNVNQNAWYFLYIQEATNCNYHEMKDCGIYKTWVELAAPRNWRALERPYSVPEDIFR